MFLSVNLFASYIVNVEARTNSNFPSAAFCLLLLLFSTSNIHFHLSRFRLLLIFFWLNQNHVLPFPLLPTQSHCVVVLSMPDSYTQFTLASSFFFFSLAFSTIMIDVTKASCDSGPVKPTTPLVTFLEQVQQAALTTLGKSHFDPKLYVDLSLKYDLSSTQNAFHKLPRSANGSALVKDFTEFINDYFEGAGHDVVLAKPEDFVPEPEGFLPDVKNPEVRAWALEVHSLWKNLSRKVAGGVHKRPEYHTLLPLPQQFIIPGSRFREVYYWDSYWVIR